MDQNNQKAHKGNKRRGNGVSLVFRATASTNAVAPTVKKTDAVKPAATTSVTTHNHNHGHTNRPHHGAGGHAHRKPMGHGHSTGTAPRKSSGGRGGRRHSHGKHQSPNSNFKIDLDKKRIDSKPSDIVPPLAPDSIRIIPLGGVEEIGKNMTAIEFGNDIIVVDIGFQFRDENTPGIDYILPNTKYLEDRKDKVRAVIVTHGHLDHIGGIPYVMPRIGNPPLYSRNLTTVMIKKRQEEFPNFPALDIRVIEKDETVTIGGLKIQFFGVTHTIPDSMGVIIHTPYGAIVHTGDLKLDHDNGVASEAEEAEYKKFENMNVLMLMADSTNVENPGFSIPEKTVHKNIEEIIKNVQGRLIVATFASLLERILKIVEFAEKYGKKVVVEGRSMKTNIEICKYLGLLKAKKETIIPVEEMELYPPDRIIIMATGAQGDEYAAMMRIANKTHKYVKISAKDTILLSSSIVPGNERAVQKLKDNLSRQGAKIIHYRIADVHSSGHANKDEMAWIHKKVNSKFFMPLHGYHYMLRVHGEIAKSRGLKDEDVIIPDNGTIVEIQDGGKKLVRLKEKAPSGIVMVDGFSIGDIQEVVIRDRQMLAEDGIFIVFAVINSQTGKLKRSPDIISRGFVYLRESQELLHETRLVVKRTIENTISKMNPINYEYVKSEVTDEVDKFLFIKTAKKPIVIPVIIGI
jgi:ribonuclease J